MTVSLDQLKLRFLVQNVPPHGECVVVPGDKFDPDWEVSLDEGGYGCINTDVDGKPVTVVPVTKRPSDGKERTVYEPRGGPRKVSVKSVMKGPQWGLKDEQHLIERFNELKGNLEEKCRILAKEFQGRSPNTILQKYHKLVKAGLPRPVKRGRPKKAVSPALQKEMDKALENVCPDCGLPKDLCCCDEEKKESLIQEPRAPVQKDPVEKLLQEILDILSSEQKSFTFNYHCRKCRVNGTADDKEVWTVCPRCGRPLIVWSVE